jgi:hypothetical protein
MSTPTTADEVMQIARGLPPLEKAKLIEKLSPDVKEALTSPTARNAAENLDDQYAHGYEQVSENVADLQSLLPHLPLPPQDQWQ